MKTILTSSKETKDYLESLPKIYIIHCWATWGFSSYPFEKFEIENKTPIPYVWHYNDHNGLMDQYELITYKGTTSGMIHSWTFSEEAARLLAESLNQKLIFNKNYDII